MNIRVNPVSAIYRANPYVEKHIRDPKERIEEAARFSMQQSQPYPTANSPSRTSK